jgi:uncharacterized protein
MLTDFFSKRQRRWAIIHVFCLPLILMAAACASAQPAKQPAPSNNCLWVAETPSVQIYLLGSLHLLRSTSYPLAKAIEDAYASSPKVVFETDLDAMLTPENQAMMLSLGLYPEGQTLLQNLSADTRSLLEETLQNLGLPLEQFVRFRPWLLAVTLTTFELQRLGFNPLYGVDVHFFGKAKTDEKEMDFLEPVEFQLNLLAKMNPEDQVAFLRQTLKDLEVAAKMADDMVKYWEMGDVANLHAILSKSFDGYPRIRERLLTQRNQDWVEKIENLLAGDKNALVIVGAGHLVGPHSLVQLLSQKGYTVNQK